MNRLFPLGKFFQLLGLLIVFLLLVWPIRYVQLLGPEGQRNIQYNNDRFFAQTDQVNFWDKVKEAQFDTNLILILIAWPLVMVGDYLFRKKLLSSLLLSPIVLIALVVVMIVIGYIVTQALEKYLGRGLTNEDIIKLEKIQLQTSDSTGNGVPDRINVYLTINGDDLRNIAPNGHTAFGGLNLCLSAPRSLTAITCEHFYFATNKAELNQDRLEVGMNVSTTYLFTLETPLKTDLTKLTKTANLWVTADFRGQDYDLLFYDQKVNNTLDFNHFENIGIQQDPSEGQKVEIPFFRYH